MYRDDDDSFDEEVSAPFMAAPNMPNPNDFQPMQFPMEDNPWQQPMMNEGQNMQQCPCSQQNNPMASQCPYISEAQGNYRDFDEEDFSDERRPMPMPMPFPSQYPTHFYHHHYHHHIYHMPNHHYPPRPWMMKRDFE